MEHQMRLLAYDDLKPEKGINFSKTQIWRLEKAKDFPTRIQLSASRHGWSEQEIDKWIAERIAARDEAKAA
jgi:prophage regulatory protein